MNWTGAILEYGVAPARNVLLERKLPHLERMPFSELAIGRHFATAFF
jgi:hypothetical protein